MCITCSWQVYLIHKMCIWLLVVGRIHSDSSRRVSDTPAFGGSGWTQFCHSAEAFLSISHMSHLSHSKCDIAFPIALRHCIAVIVTLHFPCSSVKPKMTIRRTIAIAVISVKISSVNKWYILHLLVYILILIKKI